MADLIPQKGYQTKFLSCPADVVIGGSGAGVGKAGSNKSLVMTDLGYKAIGEIKPGDFVLNPEGYKNKVIATYPQGIQPIYRVSFDDGSNYDCTLEHLWLVWKARKGDQASRIYTTEMLLKELKRGSKLQIPCTEPVIFHNVYQNGIKIDSYILGLILGDGGITHSITISSNDSEIWESVKNGGYELSEFNKCTRNIYLKGKGKLLKYELIRLGLFGKKSEGKFIPKSYLFGTIQQRISILQGLFDTDGYAADKRSAIEFTTVSYQLAQDVRWLVQSLGGRCTQKEKIGSYKKNGIKIKCQRVYRLYIKLPASIEPFRLSRKIATYRKPTINTFRRIVSINYLEDWYATCIKVSNPNGLYLGNEFIVTHNTFALLLDSLRGTKLYKQYAAIIFRRSYPEIVQPGGLWDESNTIYPVAGGFANESKHHWTFDTGARINFRYLSSDTQLDAYQGAQIPWIGWDEITHFTRKQFIYMLSRNRWRAGLEASKIKLFRPKIRGTCNPDPDSFVAELVDWYIDQESGFPIPKREGVIRYFTVADDMFIFGSSREEVYEKAKEQLYEQVQRGTELKDIVKSFAFIPGKIDENKILLKTNPGYLANLMAQSEEEKLRLLYGNWKIRVDKLSLFEYLKINDMFDPDLGFLLPDPDRVEYYITIDHAREGKDLCVIGTWKGWKCVRIDIFQKSNTNDILAIVRELRRIHKGIPVSNIIIDQDGIGVKDSLDCRIFQGGAQPYETKPGKFDRQPIVQFGSGEREPMQQPKFVQMYENRKTQFYYLLSEKVNTGLVWVDLNNIFIHHSTVDHQKITKLKLFGKEKEIREWIRDDLRTLKRENPDAIGRKKITPKDMQKIALGGRSPDFGDMMMMRGEFEFVKKPMYLS